MNIFEKLRSGAPVDMMAEEYQPVIQELIRANKALYHVNHTEPGTPENAEALRDLFVFYLTGQYEYEQSNRR